MRIDLYIHNDDSAIEQKLNKIVAMLTTVLQKENHIMALIDDLEAGVAANGDAEDSAITLLNNLTALIQAAGTDPARLQAVIDTVNAKKAALAAAIVANTPHA